MKVVYRKGWVKIQQMYENLELDLDLKPSYCLWSLERIMKVVYRKGWVKIQQMYENLELDLDLKLLFMVTGTYYERGL